MGCCQLSETLCITNPETATQILVSTILGPWYVKIVSNSFFLRAGCCSAFSSAQYRDTLTARHEAPKNCTSGDFSGRISSQAKFQAWGDIWAIVSHWCVSWTNLFCNIVTIFIEQSFPHFKINYDKRKVLKCLVY